MSIDFTQVVTAEDKAAKAEADRASGIKTECGKRIVASISVSTQSNIAQAVTNYTALVLRGATQEEAVAASGLNDTDFALVAAGRGWIAAMQVECRRAIAVGDEPAWPEFPAEVADLVARF